MDVISLGDIVQILIPASLMLFVIRKLTSLDVRMAELIERGRHVDQTLEYLHKAKHDHANRIQDISNRVTLIEYKIERKEPTS